MFYLHSLTLLVRVSVSLVSIAFIPKISDAIDNPQILSPANMVFSGIGILLSVIIFLDLSDLAIMMLTFLRRLKL